jgi:diguanylate cyclase (GGDEF)-like protein
MAENTGQEDFTGLSAVLKSDLFSNLLPGEKQSVLARTGSLLLREGGVLFSSGEKAERFFLLLNGLVRVLRPGHEGEDYEIARFTPGDIFGDFDFARDAEYDATVEAVEDSTLIMFPGFGFTLDSFAREAPHVVSKILINAAAMVTGRIKGARNLLIESKSWVQELHRQIHEDPGTGLWRQSFLDDEINRLLEKPMALIMLKPDRFKILVDAQGHEAGDKVMIKIAAILKGMVRRQGRGWALRFRSNETGILINRCDPSQAASLAQSLREAVAAIPPWPMDQAPGRDREEDFSFTGSVAWGVWPADDDSWGSFFEGTYRLLTETWKDGGNRIARYKKEKPS